MKELTVSLRMEKSGDTFPIPTSEEQYNRHLALVDVVLPTHAGRIQPDGTWLQPESLNDAFAQRLPAVSRAAGQRYIPVAWGNVEDTVAIVTNPDAWQTAADGLVALATERFDAPWDGIIWDAISIPQEHFRAHEGFIQVLSSTVRQAGLLFGIAHNGILPEHEDWAISLDVIAQTVDLFQYYMYCWWLPPRSLGPYWWAERSLINALEHGIPHRHIYLGIHNYARYAPVTGQPTEYEITYQQAMDLIQEANSCLTWVERDEHGLVRELYAPIGQGHIWLSNGEVVRHRLHLVDTYSLGGAMLFAPGMGTESVWRAIDRWKRPVQKTATRSKYRDLYSNGGLFGSLAMTGAMVGG